MPPYDPYGFGSYGNGGPVPWNGFGTGGQGFTPNYQAGPTGSLGAADPQLEWIAAINGQDVPTYLNSQAGYQANGNQPPPTPYQQWQTTSGDVGQNIWNAQQGEAAAIRQMSGLTDSYNQGLGVEYQNAWDIQNGARARADGLGAVNQGLIQRANASTNWANGQDMQAFGNFQGAVSNAGAWDMQNFNSLVSAANAPMQMNASAYVGDARSDPADVARQVASYNQLQGAANGSLDVTSRAANAYADARDVMNQEIAADTLRAAGDGALNVDLQDIRELDKLRNPDSIGGMQDLLAASRGSKDVHVGQGDPAAYAAAVATREKLWGLTDPSVTAQEKLMFELARQQQEQDEGATRSALMTDARRRGVSGVGTEIARSALGAQQTSRNRMLQDMQALAQAQARSQDALAAHGTLSTNMTAQGNQIALQNASNQLDALGQYTGVHANSASLLGQIGAANATQNANRQLQAQAMAYDAYATLRAQGFSEEFARGQAADIVASQNSDRRLGAMNSSANLASTMRGQSDAMSTFNQSQRQQQSQFSDMYTANRQDAQFGRAESVFGAGNTVGRNYMSDQGQLFDAHTGVTGRIDGRNQGTIQTERGLNNDWMTAQQNADIQAGTSSGIRQGVLGQQFGNNSARIGLGVQQGRQAVQDATTIRGNRLDDEQRAIVNGPRPGAATGPVSYPAYPSYPSGAPASGGNAGLDPYGNFVFNGTPI